MKSVPFILSFGIITMLFAAANVASYFSERNAYYKFLEETGWYWAGSWSWGFPFGMMIAGLGFDNHSELAPLGFALNVLIWMIVAGFGGICCEVLANRFRANSE